MFAFARILATGTAKSSLSPFPDFANGNTQSFLVHSHSVYSRTRHARLPWNRTMSAMAMLRQLCSGAQEFLDVLSANAVGCVQFPILLPLK